MNDFHFFLAEDHTDTREQLAKLLKEAFPSAVVDAVDNVKEGLHLLEEARSASYDIAFLDFKLPRERGDNPEVDESLCPRLRRDSRTLICHITGYASDPVIRRHLEEVDPPSDGFVIDKTESGWPGKCLAWTRQYLYGERIERQIERLFGRAFEGPAGAGRTNRLGSIARPSGSLTNAIADLSLDISQYWQYLHPAVRERIQLRFEVEAGPTGIKVTVR
jgi:CheY-like chemotaxis protein